MKSLIAISALSMCFFSGISSAKAGNPDVSVHRLFKIISRGSSWFNDGKDFNHFYTTSQSEADSATRDGYKYEGIVGKCFSADQGNQTEPLYRLYSDKIFDHFYTTDPVEKNAAINGKMGYFDNGVLCYVHTRQISNAVCPLYRLWIGATQSNHFYTMSGRERDGAITATGSGGYAYKSEGIAGYLYPYNRPTCPD